MKKRYIDFVPVDKGSAAKGPARTVARPKAAKPTSKATVKSAPRATQKAAPKPAAKPVVKAKITRREPDELPIEELFVERKRPAGVSTGLKTPAPAKGKEPKYGVIEEYHRPGTKPATSAVSAARPASAARGAGAARGISMARGAGARPVARDAASANKSYIRPATHFINTEKIEKRPLSKSSILKKKPVVIPEKEPSDPARIITKPEKDSKAGLIIAVILTIILGAAAGTVAFLLLPK